MSNPAHNGAASSCYAASDSDKVMGDISMNLAMAAVRKDHQAEMAAFLQKVRSAGDEYTVQKRIELVRRWTLQDDQIEELVKALVALPGWTAGIDDVCARYAAIRSLENCLHGNLVSEPPDQPRSSVNGLYWKRAWQQEHRDVNQRARAQARLQLAAWEKPAQTLDKILADSAKLIEEGFKMLDQQDPALPFVVFFKLVPMHLQIMPPGVTSAVTPLDMAPGGADYKACVAVALDLLGPQPSLILPSEYLDKKVEEVLAALTAAAEALASAEGALKKTEDAIARSVRQLEDKKKSLDKEARAALQAAAVAPPAAAPKPGAPAPAAASPAAATPAQD